MLEKAWRGIKPICQTHNPHYAIELTRAICVCTRTVLAHIATASPPPGGIFAGDKGHINTYRMQ